MIPTLSPVYSLLSSFTLSVLVLLLYAYVLPYHSPKDTRCPKTMHGHLEVLSKFRVLYVKTSSSASQNSRLRRNGTTVVEWRDPKRATKEGWGSESGYQDMARTHNPSCFVTLRVLQLIRVVPCLPA